MVSMPPHQGKKILKPKEYEKAKKEWEKAFKGKKFWDT